MYMLDCCRDNGKENGNYQSTSGLCRDNGKEDGNYYRIFYWGYLWIMEKNMETTVAYLGYIRDNVYVCGVGILCKCEDTVFRV